MKLHNIPIHYISFNKNSDLEKSFALNGLSNINHYQAVNGKKKDLKQLYDSGILSAHSLHTIQNVRCGHKDVFSKGAVGCYLSHLELWKYAIQNKLPFIMIAEDDFRMKKVKPEKILSIQNEINRLHAHSPRSLFLMDFLPMNLKWSKIQSGEFNIIDSFCGFGCYIVSLEACKELVKRAFPISTQVDCFASIMQQNEYIQVYGLKQRWSYFILDQLNSSIQDICVKCFLPHHYGYYIVVIVLIILISYKAYTCKVCKS